MKQVPSRLETDDIKVVAGLQLPLEPLVVNIYNGFDDSVLDLNGLSSHSVTVVDPSLTPNPASVFPYNASQDKELRVISCAVTINLSPAAVAAQLGNRYALRWWLKPINWDIGLWPPSAWPSPEMYVGGIRKNGNSVVAGINSYLFSMPGIDNADAGDNSQWSMIIPHNFKFGFTVTNLNNAQSAAATWGPAALDSTMTIFAAFHQAEKGFFHDLPR